MTCPWSHQYWAGSNRVNLSSRMLVVMQRQSGVILSSYDGIIVINGWYQSIAWLQYCYHTMTWTCLCSSARVNTKLFVFSSYDHVIIWWHLRDLSSVDDILILPSRIPILCCHHMMTYEGPCHPLVTYTLYIDKNKKFLPSYDDNIETMSSYDSNWGSTFCDKLYDSNIAIWW